MKTKSTTSLSVPAAESRPISTLELERFFTTVDHLVELAAAQQRRLDKLLATGFNVFHLIEPDENNLSDILANLLDPNGTHGQGDIFLGLLFKQLGMEADMGHTRKVRVQREARTHGIVKDLRRIDILVDADVLLAIENKVDSLEQPDQVRDYLEHLSRCGRGRRTCLIYLTPDGRLPQSTMREQNKDRLHCWSYQNDLRVWLDACWQACEAQRICDFLMDFINYIASDLKRDITNNQKGKTDGD